MDNAVFGNPLFAWLAAAAAAIPLIIHLLNRQRHREVPWAAMRFLLAANRRSVRRTRIEQWLLLILRTLVILLVPLAMARPQLEAGHATPLLGGNRHHIIVVDDSLSLTAPATPREREVTGLARHLETARALLDSLPDGDPISVVTLSYPARLINPDPARTRGRARQLLEQILPQDTRGDLRGALHKILAIADDPAAPDMFRTVHLFSDFTPGLFDAPADDSGAARTLQSLADSVARAATLALYPLPQGDLANQALVDLRVAPRIVATGQPARILADVVNRGASRGPERHMAMSVDGRAIGQQPVPALDPGARHTVETTVEFNAPGLHTIECVLSDVGQADSLVGDDVARLVIEVKNHIPVLIIDGKPGASVLDGQAGYIATALAPKAHDADKTVIQATVMAEHELPGLDLERFDVIVLCNVRRLPSSEWERLHNAARRGCGVVLFLGDLVDIAHYNEAAAELLPATLTRRAHDGSGPDTSVQFDAQTVRAPLDAHFAGRESSGLFLVTVHNFIDVADEEDTAGVRLLAYDNGRPAILARRLGDGHAILVTTSANMDWSTLPAKGDFVTLVMALIRHAAPPNAPAWNVIAGGAVRSRETLGSPAAAAAARLRTTDGTLLLPRIDTRDDGYRFEFTGITHSGWYNLEGPAAEGPVAANPDPSESDLRRLGESDIKNELGCPLQMVKPRRDSSLFGRTTAAGLAPLLIYAALMLMFAETLAALWFGRVRK